MLQIGFLEITIILIIGLLVIGPKRLPELVKNLLKFYKKIQNQFSEFKNNFEEDIGADDIKKDVFNEMRMEELEGFEQKRKMNSSSVSSHLIELRSRLIKTLICMGILTIIGLPFAAEIYSFVASPLMSVLPSGSSMIATGVSSPFMAPIKLTLFVALLLSMPYFFYQMWLFMSPGLYKNEKGLVLPLMTSTIFLFIAGVAFAYYVVCPIIFSFFINSAPDSIVVMTDISQYLNFVLRVTFAFGVAFEMPVATYLIIRSGIAKKEKLKKARPYLIVLFFILGMLLTPPDVFSQLFLAIPMWLLFELGLFISKDKI